MFKPVFVFLLLSVASFTVLAVNPTFYVLRKIDFGTVLLGAGSCSMDENTGVVSGHIGQFICIPTTGATNGRYYIIANPNKTIRFKVLPNLDTGAGVVFNPYVKLVSQGIPDEVIYNDTGYVDINSGATGMVSLYLGGELNVSASYSHSETINFSFVDAIEWFEVP